MKTIEKPIIKRKTKNKVKNFTTITFEWKKRDYFFKGQDIELEKSIEELQKIIPIIPPLGETIEICFSKRYPDIKQKIETTLPIINFEEINSIWMCTSMYGEIRRCEDEQIIKIALSDNFVKHIINEIEKLESIDNEHIVKPKYLVTYHDKPIGYSMQDYGENLKKWLNRTQPDTELIKIIMSQIRKGVKYMHEKNIIHGDLFMENILVRENKAVIIDFGCSIFEGEKIPEDHPIRYSQKLISKDYDLKCVEEIEKCLLKHKYVYPSTYIS